MHFFFRKLEIKNLPVGVLYYYWGILKRENLNFLSKMILLYFFVNLNNKKYKGQILFVKIVYIRQHPTGNGKVMPYDNKTTTYKR